MSWDEAVSVVQNALATTPAGEMAFLMGMTGDHLFDLVNELTIAMAAPAPVRFGAHEIFDTRLTLKEAVKRGYSADRLPYFDLANADVVFSFGANFLETFLSPVAYSRGFALMRRGHPGQRGYMVQFEPRLSQTAATADEWIQITPGSEALVALAIGYLAADARGGAIPNAFLGVDLTEAVAVSGVSEPNLRRLATIFAQASHPLAIPGGGSPGSGERGGNRPRHPGFECTGGQPGQPGRSIPEPSFTSPC